MKLSFLNSIMFGLLAWNPASADASTRYDGFPPPDGLRPCASGDPVATTEEHVATTLGGEFLGCFQSMGTIDATSAPHAAKMPVEYAFAMGLKGQAHTLAELENLLSTVREQWKNFDPLSKKFKDYTAAISDMVRGNGSAVSPTITSIKPVLVSIDRANGNYFMVTSIRTYVLALDAENVRLIKVNCDAVVLRRSQFIRLTIQRTLSNPADVAQVQGEIDDWARAVAKS